jgi:hypothetical protein
MGILNIYAARKLNKVNAADAEELRSKKEKLKERAKSLESRYGETLRFHCENQLFPFSVTFEKIKNCTIDDVDVLDRVPAMRTLEPETCKFSIDAVQGLVSVAGGLAVGVSAAQLTLTAVGALATASTGTAISGLTGAAAANATYAWLGGGALAAGGNGIAGGIAVLGGVTVLPAVAAGVGWVWWKGSKELTKQKADAAKLKAVEADLNRGMALLDGVAKRITHSSDVLRRLGQRLSEMNDWLGHLLTTTTDYRLFDEDQKQRLAVHVSLATAMTAVMSADLVVTSETRAGTTTVINSKLEETLEAVEELLSGDLGDRVMVETSDPAEAIRKGVEDTAVWVSAAEGAQPGERWAADLVRRAAASTELAERVRERLSVLGSSEPLLNQIVQRWSGAGHAQFAGRIFEYHHATTFNMSAAEAGVQRIRAVVAEFEGTRPDPHAAADIRVLDPSGQTLAEVQAKAVAATSQRVHELAAERYAGCNWSYPATTSIQPRTSSVDGAPQRARTSSSARTTPASASAWPTASELVTPNRYRFPRTAFVRPPPTPTVTSSGWRITSAPHAARH